MEYTTLNKCKKEKCEGFEVIEEYESIKTWYGMNILAISDDEIKALKEGKGLYYTDGEFATVIYRR